MSALAERYLELSARYLAEAEELLAKGELQQASEKLWGAAAEAVKAVAEAKGWRHYRHRELEEAVERLCEEVKDPELPRLWASALRLHANFYEGFMGHATLKLHAEDVKRLVEKLRQYVASQPSPKGA